MAISALAQAGIGLIPTLYKGISSIFQKNKANKINHVDPGYAINNAVVDNARTLSNRANNFQIAGYDNAVNNINATGANAFNAGVAGASSGGDVLDLATRIAYGQGQRLNQLALENAQGADQALLQSLNANAQAGQEFQNKNAYDRQQYERQLREKAALTQAANENAYGALDTGATVVNSLLNPVPTTSNGTSTTSPQSMQKLLRMMQINNANNSLT